MWFEILLVFILFKFKNKRPNIPEFGLYNKVAHLLLLL